MPGRHYKTVEKPSELRASDLVMVDCCRICGGRHYHVLLREVIAGQWTTLGKFHVTEDGDPKKAPTLTVGPAIADGRLSRLAPGTLEAARAMALVGQ